MKFDAGRNIGRTRSGSGPGADSAILYGSPHLVPNDRRWAIVVDRLKCDGDPRWDAREPGCIVLAKRQFDRCEKRKTL